MGLQECVEPLESKNTVFAQRRDKRNFEPTFPRVFGPCSNAAQSRAQSSAAGCVASSALLQESTASASTASNRTGLQISPGTTLMRDSYRSAEGHLRDAMRNGSIVHQGQRQAKVCGGWTTSSLQGAFAPPIMFCAMEWSCINPVPLMRVWRGWLGRPRHSPDQRLIA